MYGPWLTENSLNAKLLSGWARMKTVNKRTIPFREWNLNGRHVLDTLLMLAEPYLCYGIHKND